MDALYDTLRAIVNALEVLGIEYIVTGGSLLGAIRQHSILFCDDDIDVAIIDRDGASYEKVSNNLSALLGDEYTYVIKPWEGGDKVRPKWMTNVFVDIFCLRRYETMDALKEVIGVKKNGKMQSDKYVDGITKKLRECAFSQSETRDLCPFWHFATRKAVEMWTKEVYREAELFPLCTNLKFGSLVNIKGPRCPVLLLKRAFGNDCFHVYYQSSSHKVMKAANKQQGEVGDSNGDLRPVVMTGGTWEDGRKADLDDEHYLPCQPLARAKRRPTLHGKEQLFQYLEEQSANEAKWQQEEQLAEKKRPERVIYMDGVFDLFHKGHLEAIRQCAELGRVIIGVTGDEDAAGYKRSPIMCQEDRVAIVGALKEVDMVVCPCPLVVTPSFMDKHGIDLVVHGFANDADAERQRHFFEVPISMGKFQRIAYYSGDSTTKIIERVQALPQPKSETKSESKPQWFGLALANATANAPEIPYDPFPLHLRQAIEPHIRKANKRRKEALDAIRQATGPVVYDSILTQFRCSLAKEGDFSFDTKMHPLRSAFIHAAGLSIETDLNRLHLQHDAKDFALFNITKEAVHFQSVYDFFVREVCAPRVASLFHCDEIYYQCFPCVRIVQPNEFSIGPHADVAYGHHPCSALVL